MNETMLLTRILPEVFWRTSRSSGKGGQHVNKTESKVELLFSYSESQLFTPEEKERLNSTLSKRFPQGMIHITSQESRSQQANKTDALNKLVQLLQKSLVPVKKRKATKPSKASKLKKLETKKRHSDIKKQRSKRNWNND